MAAAPLEKDWSRFVVVSFVLIAITVAWLLPIGFSQLLRVGPPRTSAQGQEIPPVPSQLGLWVGTSLPADSSAFMGWLGTSGVSLMEYHLGQEPPVWFSQVAGFRNRAARHPSEPRRTGDVLQILEREPVPVYANGRERQVMRLVLERGGERYETWYWFTADGRATPSYYRQQLWLLMDSIRRHPMTGALIQVSTPVDSPAQTRRRLLAFFTSWDQLATQSTGHAL